MSSFLNNDQDVKSETSVQIDLIRYLIKQKLSNKFLQENIYTLVNPITFNALIFVESWFQWYIQACMKVCGVIT